MAPPGLKESRVARPVGPPSKSIGQIERELDTARGRREFFSNRPDVSDDGALRRMKQADELQQFKNLYTKPVQGSSNLLQMKQGAPRSLAEESMRLANQYGPTFREIGSDIGYGIKSIGSALGERISQGRIGILGIAKDLYEQFTNSATKAKDALVKGVEKLSDIDLEILKNKGQYKFLSKKPEIQEVESLQKTQMTEFDKANIIRQGIEQLETTPITGTTTLPQQPPGFKVMSPEQKQLLSEINASSVGATSTYDPNKDYLQQQEDYYYQDKERFSPQGNQYLYADASQQDIDRINKMRQLKSMDPQSIYDMRDVFQLSPELTLEDIQGIKEGTITQPTGIFAAEGGMIDKKLDNLQKKTNNIYGTGILSVR